MTTPPTAMTTPEPLQLKLSAQQRRDFTACAQMCGLELAAWIVQCADVKAADAIDAMQAEQRVERPSRKPQKPRLRVDPPAAQTDVERTGGSNRAAKSPPPSIMPTKSPVSCSVVESTSPKSTTDPEVRGIGTGKPPKRTPSSGAERATAKKVTSSETSRPLPKKATLRAARSYNERFRRKLDASTEQRDEGVR